MTIRPFVSLLVLAVAASPARAEDLPSPAAPPPPAAPVETVLTPVPDEVPAEPAPPAPEPPAPEPPAPVVPPPAPPAAAATPAVTASAEKPFEDDYYSRERGVGMFHRSRLVIGVLGGTAPDLMDGAAPAPMSAETSATRASLAFDATFLELPSSYGHFHGIELSTGLRSTPIDFWLQFGTAVTFANLGRGGPGSLRIGGGFGAGFNLAHGYGYVRARAAFVILPARLDGEVSVQWTPSSASTGNYDERLYRASAWYRFGRPGKSKRALEVYVESYQRVDMLVQTKHEFTGVGGGVGISLF